MQLLVGDLVGALSVIPGERIDGRDISFDRSSGYSAEREFIDKPFTKWSHRTPYSHSHRLLSAARKTLPA